VKNNLLPKPYANLVDHELLQRAEEAYIKQDKSVDLDSVKEDIARKLLKLRVTYEENSRIKKSYRVDFRILDDDFTSRNLKRIILL
jgi:hypothetical protein